MIISVRKEIVHFADTTPPDLCGEEMVASKCRACSNAANEAECTQWETCTMNEVIFFWNFPSILVSINVISITPCKSIPPGLYARSVNKIFIASLIDFDHMTMFYFPL